MERLIPTEAAVGPARKPGNKQLDCVDRTANGNEERQSNTPVKVRSREPDVLNDYVGTPRDVKRRYDLDLEEPQ